MEARGADRRYFEALTTVRRALRLLEAVRGSNQSGGASSGRCGCSRTRRRTASRPSSATPSRSSRRCCTRTRPSSTAGPRRRPSRALPPPPAATAATAATAAAAAATGTTSCRCYWLSNVSRQARLRELEEAIASRLGGPQDTVVGGAFEATRSGAANNQAAAAGGGGGGGGGNDPHAAIEYPANAVEAAKKASARAEKHCEAMARQLAVLESAAAAAATGPGTSGGSVGNDDYNNDDDEPTLSSSSSPSSSSSSSSSLSISSKTSSVSSSFGAKVDALVKHVTALDGSEKVVVFSSWKDSLLLAADALRRSGVCCGLLLRPGATPRRPWCSAGRAGRRRRQQRCAAAAAVARCAAERSRCC